MQIETVTYRTGRGWSQPLPTALDSASTLVLAFVAPELCASPAPLQELARALPNSMLVGCSSRSVRRRSAGARRCAAWSASA